MIAWIVLIVSALVLAGFIVFIFVDDWKSALIALLATSLLFGAAYGLSWSLLELFG